MRWWIFSALFLCSILFTPARAFEWTSEIPDSLAGKYDQRIYKYHRWWQGLIPSHTVLQYAGSIGFLSAGVGWDYGKRDQWETTVLLGYLPKYNSQESKLTFTLKQNYTPWSLPLKPGRLTVEPLTCGLFFNTIFSDEFWVDEPDRYPKGYYGFSTRIRTHLFVGQRLTHHFSGKDRKGRSITAYYELNTCDLYLVSLCTNPDYLKLKDILSLSVGIKLQIF